MKLPSLAILVGLPLAAGLFQLSGAEHGHASNAGHGDSAKPSPAKADALAAHKSGSTAPQPGHESHEVSPSPKESGAEHGHAADAAHGDAPKPAPAPPSPAKAGAPAAHAMGSTAPQPGHESHEVSPSLKESGHLIANSNLVSGAHPPEKSFSPEERFNTLFNLARQQRKQKNNTEAAKNLALVIESAAPDEMKRTAFIELAVIAQEENQPSKAQQILAQYVKKYQNDPGVPEVLLRQGLLYRQMGAPKLAIAKFYAVMTTALTLKSGDLDYYQRLVLHAQTEIADTHFLQGEHEEALELLNRLLKLDSADLKKNQLHFKLIRCLVSLGRQSETISQAEDFLVRHPAASEEPEIRYLLATALKQLNRNQEALQQVVQLLKSEKSAAEHQPERWTYWQQRAGNDIANQLYQEGDYLNSLSLYEVLASLDTKPAWQLPVWYQMGLNFERLEQPAKAIDTYQRILAREKELAPAPAPALKTVLDMARWRTDFLNWQTQASPAAKPGVTNAQINKAAAPLTAAK